MSGRGKRRDNTPFAQAIRTLDLKQDDIPTNVQPPPLYPPLLGKPKPLLRGPEYDYMASMREDLKEKIRQAGYYIPPVAPNRDVERYSDKYQPWSTTKTIEWDQSLFPAELFEDGPPPKKNKKKKKASSDFANAAEFLTVKLDEGVGTSKGDEKVDQEEEPAEGENDEENEALDEEDEEEGEDIEEGTDYVMNYCDNDENYLDEAEDHLEDTQLY